MSLIDFEATLPKLSRTLFEQTAYRLEGAIYCATLVAATALQTSKTILNFTVSVLTFEYFSKYSPHLSLPAAERDLKVLALFISLFVQGFFEVIFSPVHFHRQLNCSIWTWTKGIINWAVYRPYHDQPIDHLFPAYCAAFFANR